MPNEINLIPNEIVEEQSSERQQRGFLYFSFIVLVVCLIITGVAWSLSLSTNVKLNNTEKSINQAKQELATLEEVERKGATLQLRLEYIKKLLANKIHHSKILEEIDSRSRNTVVVEDVALTADGILTLKGKATSTAELQNYVVNLVKEPDNLFTNARVLEVNVGESGVVNFAVSVDIQMDKIK